MRGRRSSLIWKIPREEFISLVKNSSSIHKLVSKVMRELEEKGFVSMRV